MINTEQVSKQDFFSKELSYFVDKYKEKNRIYSIYKDDRIIETFDLRKWSEYIRLCNYIEEKYDSKKEMLQYKTFITKHDMIKISYDNIEINDYENYSFFNKNILSKEEAKNNFSRSIENWKKKRDEMRDN